MKKTLFIFFLFIGFSFKSYSQCWVPAIPSHCKWMTQHLNETANSTYAVFQANNNCVYIKWDFDFWQENYLVGLKLFIHGGGVFDLVTLYDFCEDYAWDGSIPSPFYRNRGRYIYYSNQITDPKCR